MRRLATLKLLVMEELKNFWHLCTPGKLSGEIFMERKDYVFGMNLVALVAAEYRERVEIYTFQLMSNHLHFAISGNKEDINDFFWAFFKRLRRYLVTESRLTDLKGFFPNLIAIDNVPYLRNLIAYINRNGFLVNKDTTPFSYYWGANRYFFSLIPEYETNIKVPLDKVPVNERRRIFRSHFNDFPNCYYFIDDYVSPASYVNISLVETLFKNAHDYYYLVSRAVETFASFSKELGEQVTYTDEELQAVIYSISNAKFNSKPFELDKNAKIEIAKILHFRYNASNQQIRRVLRLDIEILEELFSSSR